MSSPAPAPRSALGNALKVSGMLLVAGGLSLWMAGAIQSGGSEAAAPTSGGGAVQGERLDSAPREAPAGVDFATLDEENPGLRPDSFGDDVIELDETPELATIERSGREWTRVTFGKLAGFPYQLPGPEEIPAGASELPERYKGQIPDDVLELSGKPLALEGFVIPLELERGRMSSFILVRSMMHCCYGVIPQMNEWVHVQVTGAGRPPYSPNMPVTVFGEFDAGDLVENGALLSIYRMNAEFVETEKL